MHVGGCPFEMNEQLVEDRQALVGRHRPLILPRTAPAKSRQDKLAEV
jgi:hypothetical protein